MTVPREFPYQLPEDGDAAMPVLRLTLHSRTRSAAVEGLVDSGSSVNVLPFDLGETLGARWDEQPTPIRLGGNVVRCEARMLLLTGEAAGLGRFPLLFAWAERSDVPLLLGQLNFFFEFDVCFFRSRSAFELRRRD